MDQPAPPALFVATPCYGGVATTTYLSALLALQRTCIAERIGIHVELAGGDALIPRARGLLAGRFLAEERFTHLLFIDADIGFTPDHVLRMLRAGHDLVGGVYPAKRIDWAKARAAMAQGVADVAAASHPYVVRFLPDSTNSVEVDADGFGEVEAVGTGFMLVTRAAVARLAAAHPELAARHGDMVGAALPAAPMLFETMIDPETREYLSEDYAFCRRWRALGGRIHADFRGRLTHVGHASYSGSLEAAQAR